MNPSIPLSQPFSLAQAVGPGIKSLRSPVFDYVNNSFSNLIDAFAIVLCFHLVQCLIQYVPVYLLGFCTHSIVSTRLLCCSVRKPSLNLPKLTNARVLVFLLLSIQLVSQVSLLYMNNSKPTIISLKRSGLRRVNLVPKGSVRRSDSHHWCTLLATGTSSSTVRPLSWCLKPTYSVFREPQQSTIRSQPQTQFIVGYANDQELLFGISTPYREFFSVGNIHLRVDDAPSFVQQNLTKTQFPSSVNIGKWMTRELDKAFNLTFSPTLAEDMVNLSLGITLQKASIFTSNDTKMIGENLEIIMEDARCLLNGALTITEKAYENTDFVLALEGYFNRLYEGSGYEEFAEVDLKIFSGGILWLSIFGGIVLCILISSCAADIDLATDVAIAETLHMKSSPLQHQGNLLLAALSVCTQQDDEGEIALSFS